MVFRDRIHGAQLLAERLSGYRDRPGVLVLGLPRGGVPMARVIADSLGAPVDVLLVRKLGVPDQPELAFGAIAEGEVWITDPQIIQHCRIKPWEIDEIAAREEAEIARRARVFRGTNRPPEVEGREVIVVDDGLATGSTMMAAVKTLRARNAQRVIVASPVCSIEARASLSEVADEVVCLSTPEPFEAVGLWYEDFNQVSDEEARAALAEVTAPHRSD